MLVYALFVGTLELPPSESFSSQVRTELRYGTKPALSLSPDVDSALMTSPRVLRDLLMLLASVRRSPDAPGERGGLAAGGEGEGAAWGRRHRTRKNAHL